MEISYKKSNRLTIAVVFANPAVLVAPGNIGDAPMAAPAWGIMGGRGAPIGDMNGGRWNGIGGIPKGGMGGRGGKGCGGNGPDDERGADGWLCLKE